MNGLGNSDDIVAPPPRTLTTTIASGAAALWRWPKLAFAGALLLALMLAAIFAPLLPLRDPYAQDLVLPSGTPAAIRSSCWAPICWDATTCPG